MLETPEKIRELQRKLYQKAKQETAKACGKNDWKAVCGKLHARFDEGELKIEHAAKI